MAKYLFPDSDAPTVLENESSLLNRLLALRDLTDETAAQAFLAPDYETQLHDPFLLNDIDKAVARIKQAMSSNERIAIFSDYDCDGIPGAVVLHDLFQALSYKHTTHYIPHRHYEGFGLSIAAVEKLHKEQVKLIITIDCGTSDTKAITRAAELGIDVIVTDHHEPPAELPPAIAIVNPKLGDYPFKELCGAAVAYKLTQAVLAKTEHNLTPGMEKWWLDMVGIATIADMVPLVDENRVFAHFGLMVLRKSQRPGLQQLLQKNRVNARYLTEDDIGFTIGPRINAASRMDTPEDAFYMLAASDVAEAGAKVEHLEQLNKERKVMVAQITKDLHKRLKALPEIPDVLVLGNPQWRPSLVGLAANKLAEEYRRPVFLWGQDGNNIYKGSCRSGGGVSVVNLMKEAKEVFLEHGGHHFSGGFSVKDEHIFTFADALNNAYKELGAEAAFEEELAIDEYLSLTDVNAELVRTLSRLAPYGTGNPKPLFAFKNVTPRKVEVFGKGKDHLKLVFETDLNQLEAIAFFSTPDSFKKTPSTESPFDLIAHVEESFFMGRKQIRLRIIDIV